MRVAHCLILVKLLLAPVTSRDNYRAGCKVMDIDLCKDCN